MSKPLILELKERCLKNILWTNPSVASNFGAQTIKLSSSDYNYLMIFYYRSPSTRTESMCCIVEKNADTELQYNDFFESYTRVWNRSVKITNGTDVTFGDNRINGGTNNLTLVPYKIIGCKY